MFSKVKKKRTSTVELAQLFAPTLFMVKVYRTVLFNITYNHFEDIEFLLHKISGFIGTMITCNPVSCIYIHTFSYVISKTFKIIYWSSQSKVFPSFTIVGWGGGKNCWVIWTSWSLKQTNFGICTNADTYKMDA